MGAPDRRADVQPPNDLARGACGATEPGHHRYQSRCNPAELEAPSNQTHGLVAHGSRRDQECGFDPIRAEAVDYLGNRFLD